MPLIGGMLVRAQIRMCCHKVPKGTRRGWTEAAVHIGETRAGHL